MTKDPYVTKMVLDMIKTIAKPGQKVKPTLMKAAYNMVRENAKKEMKEWKKKYITIEETI